MRGPGDGQDVVEGGKRVGRRSQRHHGPRIGAGQIGIPFQAEGGGGPGGEVGLDRDGGGFRKSQRRGGGGNGAEEMRLGLGEGAGGLDPRHPDENGPNAPHGSIVVQNLEKRNAHPGGFARSNAGAAVILPTSGRWRAARAEQLGRRRWGENAPGALKRRGGPALAIFELFSAEGVPRRKILLRWSPISGRPL